MKKVNWGILGCGNVTEVKSGPAFSLVSNSELVAVMRRDKEKVRDYALRHHVPNWYTNAEDLINDRNVNAIYIATPPNLHAELTIKALEARKPVYVEKPMALNYNECLQMIQASEEYNTPLFVAYYRRALPGFLKVKELIGEGRIGRVKFVNIKLHKPMSNDELTGKLPWRVKPEISGAGHFFDLASHQLDYMDFLFGPIQKVQSIVLNQSNKYKAEDFISASFLLPDDVVVSGSWSFSVPDILQDDSIEIIGEKGRIKFSCFDFIPVELITNSGIETFDYPKPQHVQQYLIQKVVDELLNKDKCPSTGISGARTNWVMQQVLNEYYNN